MRVRQLWKSRGVRRILWAASGLFFFWRLGYSSCRVSRGKRITKWNWRWLENVLSASSRADPEKRVVEDALEAILIAFAELLIVALILITMLWVALWIARGFAKDRQ